MSQVEAKFLPYCLYYTGNAFTSLGFVSTRGQFFYKMLSAIQPIKVLIFGMCMKVLLDKEKWSDSSKKSSLYEHAYKYYTELSFDCRKCWKPSVLSAEEQKHWYEVKKYYVWKTTTLCAGCFENYTDLKSELESYDEKWLNTPKEKRSDILYAKKWLTLLKDVESYGKPTNESMIAKLLQISQKPNKRS